MKIFEISDLQHQLHKDRSYLRKTKLSKQDFPDWVKYIDGSQTVINSTWGGIRFGFVLKELDLKEMFPGQDIWEKFERPICTIWVHKHEIRVWTPKNTQEINELILRKLFKTSYELNLYWNGQTFVCKNQEFISHLWNVYEKLKLNNKDRLAKIQRIFFDTTR